MSDMLFKKLEKLNIPYSNYFHEPLFTLEQAMKVASEIPGAHCKNLFLKDSNNKVYLLVAVHDTKVPLKKVSKFIQAPELRFAQEDLLQHYLGVQPGAVTPFGLMHDHEKKVVVLLDARLFAAEQVSFHPLINTATTVIASHDLKKFIESCKNDYRVVDFKAF